MRQLAAAVLQVPLAGLSYLSRYVGRRSLLTQLTIAVVTVVLVVGGLLVGLPTETIDAKEPTPYNPAAPTVSLGTATKVGVEEPYVLAFTEPMNQGSVAASLTIKPAAAVRLSWDAAGETLSIAPASYWKPFTTYAVDVAASAMDQSGMQLGSAVTAGFTTGALTSGEITATIVSDGNVAPTSAFQLTFSSPVKLATVQARLSISPVVTGTITGDDPTDVSSQVFTFTPDDILASATAYTVSFDNSNATDSAGVALLPVPSLQVQTLAAPEVLKFRPLNGHTTADPNQVLSVRFTVPMSHASTAAAFAVTVNGKRVRGSISWAENNTVLVFDPNGKLPLNATVTMHVATTARSITGQRQLQGRAGGRAKDQLVGRSGVNDGAVASDGALLPGPDELHPNRRLGDRQRRLQLRHPPRDAGPGCAGVQLRHKQRGLKAVLKGPGRSRHAHSLPERHDAAFATVCRGLHQRVMGREPVLAAVEVRLGDDSHGALLPERVPLPAQPL